MGWILVKFPLTISVPIKNTCTRPIPLLFYPYSSHIMNISTHMYWLLTGTLQKLNLIFIFNKEKREIKDF